MSLTGSLSECLVHTCEHYFAGNTEGEALPRGRLHSEACVTVHHLQSCSLLLGPL